MSKVISKDFVDESIKNSSSMEELITFVVSGLVGSLVASLFTKKSDSKVVKKDSV